MKIEYTGNITEIRAIEDCIRATKKYTEGLLSKKHPQQIQGDDFPSRVLHKHYEIYPDIPEISWNMPVNTAAKWLWSDTPCLNIKFVYDYRRDLATVSITDNETYTELVKAIPGFLQAMQSLGKPLITTEVVTRSVQRTVDA